MSKRLRASIAAVVLAACLVQSPVALAAAEDVVTIPDSALFQKLLELADADSSQSLTEGELHALDGVLDLSGLGISDISGLEHLNSVTSLDLSDNMLRSISSVKQLSLLTSLNVSKNYLNTQEGSAVLADIAALESKTPACTVDYSDQKSIPVSGITLSASSITLAAGQQQTLVATVSPADAANKTINWQSSDTSIATVSGGTVTAVAPGSATITATTADGGKSASCKVTVKPSSISSSYFKINGGHIGGIIKRTTPSQFLGRVNADAADLKLLHNNGSAVTGDSLCTGMQLLLHVGGTLRDSLTIAVSGDVNGDGQVSITDYTLTRLDILGIRKLEGINRTAADADYNGNITITDYTMIRLDILGNKPIGGYTPVELPAVSDPRIRRFLDVALAQQGKPYVWSAVGPNSFDCSGYIYYCLNQAGYKVGRTTAHSYSNYSQWTYVERDKLQPGDLMFYRDDDDPNRIGHVGIYLGNGFHIHASSSYECVIICRIDGWYDSMLTHGRRVFN